MTTWNDLSIREKAEMMRAAVRNGITTLPEIREAYNKFAEGGNTDNNTTTPFTPFLNDTPMQAAMRQLNIDYSKPENRAATYSATHPVSPSNGGFIANSDGTFTKVNPNSAIRTMAEPAAEVASYMPVIGDAMYAGEVYDAAKQGNYSTAAALAGLIALPNFIEKPLRNLRGTISKARNYLNPSLKVPEMTDAYIMKSIGNAYQYKKSPEYKDLVKRASEESKQRGFGEFSEELFTIPNEELPNVTFSKRDKDSFGGYTPATNTINLDRAQIVNTETPYHEGLHWQHIGEPEGPKYKRWTKASDKQLPNDVKDMLYDEYYFSPERTQRNNASKYLKSKVDDIVRDDTPKNAEIMKPNELHAHTADAGRAIGLKPFEPYPTGLFGRIRVNNAIKNSMKANDQLTNLKRSTDEDRRNFWAALTQNYIPGIGLTIGTTNMIFPNSSKD